MEFFRRFISINPLSERQQNDQITLELKTKRLGCSTAFIPNIYKDVFKSIPNGDVHNFLKGIAEDLNIYFGIGEVTNVKLCIGNAIIDEWKDENAVDVAGDKENLNEPMPPPPPPSSSQEQ